MAKSKTPPHMLIYMHDDGRQFVTVGVSKVGGKWRTNGAAKWQPLADYIGWVKFLKEQGHRFSFENIYQVARLGSPIIGVSPHGSFNEAVEGAAWFTTLLIDTIKQEPK